MGLSTSRIDVSATSAEIGAILRSLPDSTRVSPPDNRFRFNQSEDLFVDLPGTFEVPSLPVHHDMDKREPPRGYVEALALIVSAIGKLFPTLLAGTSWYFNPLSIHAPSFYRIDSTGESRYLYLVILDLACRPLDCEILERGSNTGTHAYRTNRLYFECDYIPLAPRGENANSIELAETIPVTWKGESGEGYMVHGIWMDADINKFFSKLILPEGKRTHPLYPVTCKHRCVSMNALVPGGPPLLDDIRALIEPELGRILEDLQNAPFSEIMPLFTELKRRVPIALISAWEGITVTPELNEREQKEYIVELH